jgi:hypothetical protein
MTTHKNVLVGRRTLITLYALVVVLAISIAIIVPTYHNYSSAHTISNSDYDSLNNSLKSYVSTHAYNNSEYYNLKGIADLDRTMTVVANLAVTVPAGGYHTESFPARYAGFVLVNITSSTTDQNYVEVSYSSQWLYYDNYVIIVGYRGISMFPVLPSDNIQVSVGATRSSSGANQTFTLTYYY